MITRLVVVNPKKEEELLVYQVPEHSAAFELLVEMLTEHGLQFVEIPATRKPKEIK